MIVVVIIGILAAVAIPSYQGFQDKAKASEAKVLLSAIYSGEKAFQAEWDSYTGDLKAAGLSASPLKYYSAGFGAKFDSETGAGDTENNFIITKAGSFSNVAAKLIADTTCTSNHKAKKSAFIACAGRDGKNDWSLDNNKVLAIAKAVTPAAPEATGTPGTP